MCAIGAVLPNDFYRPGFEAKDILSIIDNHNELPEWFKEHRLLLCDLQSAHDEAENVADLRAELETLARNWWIDDALVDTITEFRCY